MEYYSVLKKKWVIRPWKDMEEPEKHVTKWKNTIWKMTYYMISTIWHSGKGKTMEAVTIINDCQEFAFVGEGDKLEGTQGICCSVAKWPHGLEPARLLCSWELLLHGMSLPFPLPGDLPDPGIEPASPALWADSLPLKHQGSPGDF